MTVWHGLYAPAGTPKEIIDKLSRALQVALQDPKVIERFAAARHRAGAARSGDAGGAGSAPQGRDRQVEADHRGRRRLRRLNRSREACHDQQPLSDHADALLRAMFDAAVAAALPARIVPAHLPAPPKGRTIVLGAGKASAAMAKAVEDHWPGPLEGLVVTRYGHAVPCARIEIVEAAHPVPMPPGRPPRHGSSSSPAGAGPDDLVLCLISGGGSALLTLPAEGLTLADKQAVNRALLASGADIGQMNMVRKHLSAIKGGRLAAAAHPAKVVSLLISDVPGDDPAAIASGPTVADPSTFADARAVLERYRIEPPAAVRRHLAEAARGDAQARRPAAGRGRERA